MTLSDDDWREIQALKLILPDGARQEINHWIDLEVRLRHSRQQSAVTRGKPSCGCMLSQRSCRARWQPSTMSSWEHCSTYDRRR